MKQDNIKEIAHYLTSGGKGILAADESNATMGKRLETVNVESNETVRRDYREMLFSSKEAMQKYISGVILYDETIRQKAKDGRNLVDYITDAGAIIGIKVDTGAKNLANFPKETITEGLDGLRERLQAYYKLGARFAKWRAVISINKSDLPSYTAMHQNAQALARYAALCQENGIVPVVEPEVLMDGGEADHSIDRCYEVTQFMLHQTFTELYAARVDLEGMVLKPNMIIGGKNSPANSIEQVAEKTIKCLKESVPACVAGIAFLSGGQSDIDATAHLDAMNRLGNLPWNLTFSYGRALQAAALKAWQGMEANVARAQQLFAHRARMNYLAARGEWSKDLENA